MNWVKEYIRVPRYECTSINQYGTRYKHTRSTLIAVARLKCKTDDGDEIQKLVLLSHILDVPVRYDWDEHMAYIEVVSNEALKECI